MKKPKGCTSVEEWIAKGGTITRSRKAITRTVEGKTMRLMLLVDHVYRCLETDLHVYRTKSGTFKFYRCLRGCREIVARQGGQCAKHRGEE